MSDRWRYRIRNLFGPATLERLGAPGNGAPATGLSSPQAILHAVNSTAKRAGRLSASRPPATDGPHAVPCCVRTMGSESALPSHSSAR